MGTTVRKSLDRKWGVGNLLFAHRQQGLVVSEFAGDTKMAERRAILNTRGKS